MPYDNTNRGVLFKNKNPLGDKSPGYKGELNIEGVEYWLNAWLQVSQKGEKYFRVSVQPKEESRARANGNGATLKDELNDEIPF